MVDYYLAWKGCSRGILKSVLLSVEGKKVEFYNGNVPDKFEVDSEGKLECADESFDFGLSYSICGPLTDEQFERFKDFNFSDFTKEREVRRSRLPLWRG